MVTFNGDVSIECLELFDKKTSFGDKRAIEEARCNLKNDLKGRYQKYMEINNKRYETASLTNNISSSREAINRYNELMDQHVGPNVDTFIAPNVFETLSGNKTFECLKLFNEKASFGDKAAIEEARCDMLTIMNDRYRVYVILNNKRLEAAASENNTIASQKAKERYNELMDEHFRPSVKFYFSNSRLDEINDKETIECLNSFDKMAFFGDEKAIKMQGVILNVTYMHVTKRCIFRKIRKEGRTLCA